MKFKKSSQALMALASCIAIPAMSAPVLEEVLVTARKKSESLQDTPLSVSAASRETIEAAFLGDARGITQFAPNVVFDEIPVGTPGGGGLSIRGISFQDVEKSFDPTVIISLDGVPLGTNSSNVMNLLDIERIEVLRGPQGTLFGKNAVAGVVNVYRTKPSTEGLSGKVRVRAEGSKHDDAMSFEGVVNVPLSDTFAAKLNLARVETPGHYINRTIGGNQGQSEETRAGIHLLWEPTDSFVGEFQYNESDIEGILPPVLNYGGSNTSICTGFGACGAGNNQPASGDRLVASGGTLSDFTVDMKDYQVDLKWQVAEGLDAVLLAAHRSLEETQNSDIDDSPLPILHFSRPNAYEQDSVELRLDYTGDKLSITGGYFYWNGQLTDWAQYNEIPLLLGLPAGSCGMDPNSGVLCQQGIASAESDSDSVFFEGDYRLTDQISLILGARYIEETKSIEKFASIPIFDVVNLPTTNGERTDDDVIYRLGLRWEPTDELMTYLTYSTGFRSGGFSIRATTAGFLGEGFGPETVKNLEAGFKSNWLDNRLRLNASVFNMDYEEMQLEVSGLDPITQVPQDAVLNVGEANIRGVEMELSAILNDYFSIDFNAGVLDSEFKEFTGKVFANGSMTDDNTDLPLRRAPDLNYTVALNYRNTIGDGEVTSRLSYHWTDDYSATIDDFPGTHIDAFGLLDFSLGYQISAWKFSLFGRNLTNVDEYSHTRASSPTNNGTAFMVFGTPRPPRTLGAEVTYSFGDY